MQYIFSHQVLSDFSAFSMILCNNSGVSGDGKLQHSESERPVSVNSPAGDSGAALYTVDTAKCQVVTADVSNTPIEFHKQN